VALFTERREIVQVTNSQEMKDKLLNSIRLAISSQGATDVEVDDADSLLAEITGNTNEMDDKGVYESIDDDNADVQEEIVEVVASSNGNSDDPHTNTESFRSKTFFSLQVSQAEHSHYFPTQNTNKTLEY
jgi:hypothetical protein